MDNKKDQKIDLHFYLHVVHLCIAIVYMKMDKNLLDIQHKCRLQLNYLYYHGSFSRFFNQLHSRNLCF